MSQVIVEEGPQMARIVLGPKFVFRVPALNDKQSAAILLVRLVVGVAFVMHGWGKIQDPMGWMGPDSAIPGIFLALAALSEFGGGIGLILGLLNPLVAAGIGSTMAVAVYSHVILWGDSFDVYELAVVYFVLTVLLGMLGPGKFSVAQKLFGARQ